MVTNVATSYYYLFSFKGKDGALLKIEEYDA